MQKAFCQTSTMNSMENEMSVHVLGLIEKQRDPATLADILDNINLPQVTLKHFISRMNDEGLVEEISVGSGASETKAYNITMKGLDVLLGTKGIDPTKIKKENGIKILHQANSKAGSVSVSVPGIDDKYTAALINYMDHLGYLSKVYDDHQYDAAAGNIIEITPKGRNLLARTSSEPVYDINKPQLNIPLKMAP